MGVYLNCTTAYTLYKNERVEPYFVDKTIMLEEIFPMVTSGNKHICITRPRRFGKTIMANMIAAFFSKVNDASDIFETLAISKVEEYRKHLNKYNVIHISFNELPARCKTYDQYIERIENILQNDLQENFPDVKMNKGEAVWDILKRIYVADSSVRFIFVLDEWDYIFHRSFVTEYDKQEYISFLSNLLKDKPYVLMTYMTGILPIAKYYSGSELNMFMEYTMVSEEKYSEYLWKLEKNKGITKEERDAYIQLYRIIEHMNREDGRAAGSVAKAGANLTLANLYTAVKTMRAKSVDKTIDDDFGLLESGYSQDDLTKYMENMSQFINDEELHNEYKYERFIKKLDKVLDNETVSEQELMRITSSMENGSINNIYSAMLAYDKAFYKAVRNDGQDRVKAELDKLESVWASDESEMSEEHIVASYENLSKAAEATELVDTFERSILRKDMLNTFSFMAKQAENKSYYVPMEIAGEETVVHITLKQGQANEKGRITIFAETAKGKLSVLINKKAESYEVCAAVDNSELKIKLETLVEGKVVITDKVLDGMWSDLYNENAYESEAEDNNTTYGELVREAKSFIHKVLKNI